MKQCRVPWCDCYEMWSLEYCYAWGLIASDLFSYIRNHSKGMIATFEITLQTLTENIDFVNTCQLTMYSVPRSRKHNLQCPFLAHVSKS